LVFYPVGLAGVYPAPALALPPWKVAAALSILAALSAAALLARRRCPYCLVGWLWYLGMLVPVIGFVQVGSRAMADRFTYLPQIGVGVVLAWLTADLCRRRPAYRGACALAAAVALAVLTGCTWRQVSFWRDSETLWNHALAAGGPNATAYKLLGWALAEAGRSDEAIAQHRQALLVNPNSGEMHLVLAAALRAHHRIDEAMVHYRKAIELRPQWAEGHNDLAP
jgi:tetratricopeptide (TPR) repeat protein